MSVSSIVTAGVEREIKGILRKNWILGDNPTCRRTGAGGHRRTRRHEMNQVQFFQDAQLKCDDGQCVERCAWRRQPPSLHLMSTGNVS